LGRIPCGNDFLLMASQAAALAASPWKLPTSAPTHPSLHPSGSVNNLSLAELSSIMATNPAMASFYFGNIPRSFMNPTFPMMATHGGQQQPQQQNSHQSQPNIQQTPNVNMSSSFMSVQNNSSQIASMMSFPNGNPSPSAIMHPAAASALYASRLQLNSLYQNLKYHPYLQPRFMSGHPNNSMANMSSVVSNGKVELELNSPDSPNDSVPPQM
jgi:hypothetical protein